MSGHLYILSIEIDGHFHGSADVPKPWVAHVGGPCPKWGLERKFVKAMNDWADAKRAWSGNIYGVTARFPLRDGNLYEVSRLRGSSSKRRVAREFIAIERGKQLKLEPLEALARVDGGGDAAVLSIGEDRDGRSWVARVTGLGTPARLGFVVDGSERLYRVRDGLYEVVDREQQWFAGVRGGRIMRLSQREALSWLTTVAA